MSDDLTRFAREASAIANRPPLPAAPLPKELTPPPESAPLPPVGLVLAGGGSKGGYQVGVVECLVDVGMTVTAFAGTSIGALNAAVLASHDDFSSGARALATAWREVMTATGPPVEGPVNVSDLRRVQSVLAGLGSPVVQPGFLADLVTRHVGRVRKPTWVAAFPALDPALTTEPVGWVLDWVRAKAGTECHWLPLHDGPRSADSGEGERSAPGRVRPGASRWPHLPGWLVRRQHTGLATSGTHQGRPDHGRAPGHRAALGPRQTAWKNAGCGLAMRRCPRR